MHIYGNTNLGLGLGLGLGFTLGVGITACMGSYPNPDMCWRRDGDATCGELFGGSRPYCANEGCAGAKENGGCVEERPEEDGCYSPCGGEKSYEEDATCMVAEDTETESGETAETTEESESTETGPGCMGDGSAGEMRRFAWSGSA
ncbi:MAG: hypothetical protein HC927_05995 [Deltaproteobacteria bacterium]|nr:hypothetical protein [Deltaproteobacteria bacterium]